MTTQTPEYEGYTGQICVEGDILVLTRRGLAAKAAGLSGDPRRIPLRAVSGVAFTPATPMVNGSLRWGLGGASPPDETDERNCDTVLFRHQDNEVFHKLFGWLQSVVSSNVNAAGLGLAAIHAESPMPTRSPQDKVHLTPSPQDSIGTGSGRSNEAEDGAAPAPQEAWAGYVGDQRPDIAEAAARLGWTLGGRREIKHLHEHLLEGEVVRLLAQGVYEHHQGIVALTDTRLLFVFQGLFSQAQEDFPFSAITSLQTASRLGTGELRVTAAGRRATISGLIKHDFVPLVARLREALSLVQATATTVSAAVSPPVAMSDPYEALVKLAQLHDAGVISDAEFTGKKREILARM